MFKLEFNSSKLGDSRKDPENWIEELEIIQTKLGYMEYIILDDDMMIHIINYLTKEYEAINDQLETEMDTEFNELSLMDVKSR
jgi:hypothetical protein